MRAAVFYDVKDIRLEDVPEPTIGDEDVLVEVTACGICGSDLEYYYGRSPVGTPDGKGTILTLTQTLKDKAPMLVDSLQKGALREAFITQVRAVNRALGLAPMPEKREAG